MIKGLIVTNAYSHSKQVEYKISRLREEFLKYDVVLEVKDTIELGFSLEKNNFAFKDINSYSFAIYLDKDPYIAFALEKIMPLFNSATSIHLCDDKMLTYLNLTDIGVKIPYTVPSPLCYFPSPDEKKINMFLDIVESKISYPLVIKECYGSLGRQVYLIKNRDELYAKYKELIRIPHMYQEFIKTSIGKDFRIFVVDGKVVAYMLRKNDVDFRSNIALGGKGYLVKPDDKYLELASKIASKLGLTYCGIDLMIGEDDIPYLAEVNSNAFFTEIEKISKVNVTKLVVDAIAKKLNLKAK